MLRVDISMGRGEDAPRYGSALLNSNSHGSKLTVEHVQQKVLVARSVGSIFNQNEGAGGRRERVRATWHANRQLWLSAWPSRVRDGRARTGAAGMYIHKCRARPVAPSVAAMSRRAIWTGSGTVEWSKEGRIWAGCGMVPVHRPPPGAHG